MRCEIMLVLLTACVSASADGAAPAAPVRPRQVAVAASAANAAPAADDKAAPAADDKAGSAADAPKFVAEAKWLLAGYSNNEVVYTIFVTNQDARIIRCTTEVKGTYFENGQKMSIADRQITTVFPNQPTQVGNWMDLDEKSGATYSVKCHRV
jgi:hypothetical protein